MKIFNVRGTTEETKIFEPTNWYVSFPDDVYQKEDGELSKEEIQEIRSSPLIVSENRIFGTTIRKDISYEELLQKIEQFKAEGFTVAEYEFTTAGISFC